MIGIESQIQNQMFSKNQEKTFVDKLLGRKEAEEIKGLIQKTDLSRSELLKLLYLISSTEQKLLNYTEWDRYIVLKFFVWIREFISVCEIWFDFNDDIVKAREKEIELLTPEQETQSKTVRQQLEHSSKFLVDLYLNIGRSSLSVGATAFFELGRNKFEVSYPELAKKETPKNNILGIGITK